MYPIFKNLYNLVKLTNFTGYDHWLGSWTSAMAFPRESTVAKCPLGIVQGEVKCVEYFPSNKIKII